MNKEFKPGSAFAARHHPASRCFSKSNLHKLTFLVDYFMKLTIHPSVFLVTTFQCCKIHPRSIMNHSSVFDDSGTQTGLSILSSHRYLKQTQLFEFVSPTVFILHHPLKRLLILSHCYSLTVAFVSVVAVEVVDHTVCANKCVNTSLHLPQYKQSSDSHGI